MERAGDPNRRRWWTRALGVVAIVNLAVGVVLSLSHDHLADFFKLSFWAADWVHGANAYLRPQQGADYPPWALVVFAPLGLAASSHRILMPALWVIANVGCLTVIVRSLTRIGHLSSASLLAVIVGACAASRTLGQFSLFAFATALAGYASTRAWTGPLLLGVSLVKPQVGGVVWLAALAGRRWRLAATSLAVPVVLGALFAIRVGASPGDVLSGWLAALAAIHGGPTPMVGHTEIAPWLTHLGAAASTVTGRVVVTLLLCLPAVVAMRDAPGTSGTRLRQLGRLGAASLLAVRHLSYDLILLFPLLALADADDCAIGGQMRIGLLAAYLIVEPASLLRHFFHGSWATAAAGQLDRLFIAAIWVSLAWSAFRPNSSERAAGGEAVQYRSH